MWNIFVYDSWIEPTREPTWDVITRRGLAKKLWFLKRFWQWRCLSNFLLRCQESSPKISPRPSPEPQIDQAFLYGHDFSIPKVHAHKLVTAGDMRRWRFVEPFKPSISSMELAMRRDFGHGHCWGETQLEEVLHQFIICPTTDSNVFESMLLHQCSAGFLPSTGMGLYIWCMMCHFV